MRRFHLDFPIPPTRGVLLPTVVTCLSPKVYERLQIIARAASTTQLAPLRWILQHFFDDAPRRSILHRPPPVKWISDARRFEPAATRRRPHAQRPAPRSRRCRHRQNARRHLPHRRTHPQPHQTRTHPRRHVHQKSRRRNARAGDRAPHENERLPRPCFFLETPPKSRQKKDTPRPEISTFHSLCVRILRRHIKQLGFPEKFVICDRNEQESQARAVLRELRAPSTALAPGDLLGIISRWKSASVRPPQAAELAHSERDILAAAAYRRYQDNLKRVGAVDFDDLLLHTEELLTKFPAVRRAEAGRFDHVLIDEYQDTNRSQYEIVRALAGGHRNLCVVGDDDQSIYGWRGAEVTHILSFKRDWPEAKVVRLEDNYRSTAAIIAYANTLIAFNRNRHEKVLKASQEGGTRPAILQCQDETIEAQRVVADIKQAIDTKNANRAKSRSSAARTSNHARSKPNSAAPMSPTSSSAACRSSTARKSATSSAT